MPEKLNCILIDDDPEVSAYVTEMIRETSFLDLLAAFPSPGKAMEILGTGLVDLIFLDINLPGIDGMSFAKTLQSTYGKTMPRIIFISGSGDYALEGYKVDAVDYLLKPFGYESFLAAAFKAKTQIKPAADPQNVDSIYLKVEHELIRVALKDILYLESMKDYVKVICEGEKVIVALSTMKAMEEKLPTERFMRIHRSFIVALDKIDSIQNYLLKIGKTTIPVTDQYKAQFKKHLDQWL